MRDEKNHLVTLSVGHLVRIWGFRINFFLSPLALFPWASHHGYYTTTFGPKTLILALNPGSKTLNPEP
jgi:hypothetical protein